MAERTSVICDIHNKDHPATHFQVPVDMCDAAFNKYQARIGDELVVGKGRGYIIEDDNQSLLDRIVEDPGESRSYYQEITGWDQKRLVNAYNRLRKLGLVRSKGVGQGGRWSVTAAGKKAT